MKFQCQRCDKLFDADRGDMVIEHGIFYTIITRDGQEKTIKDKCRGLIRELDWTKFKDENEKRHERRVEESMV